MPRIFHIYLFTGSDNYLKKEAVCKLKNALLGKKSEAFNFNTYEAGKCSMKEVMDTLRIMPFISGKRLVILKDVETMTAAEQKILLEYAKNPSQHSCLILDASGKGLSGEFYKEIKKYAREVFFTESERTNTKEWIRKEAENRGKTIRRDAILLLRELKGDDFDIIGNEIDKLITYIGRRPVISKEDIEKIVGSSVTRNVFKFVDALGRKDAKEALVISKELLMSKKKIPEIMGMIGWQFRKTKKAKGRLSGGMKSFTSEELDRNTDYLMDADYSVKKGHLKPETALEVLIIKVCGGKQPLP
ncbi:MAG: DNA polymerase III subunit delta [Candidatus Omnitrophota bacterium]|nr:DNA polymerase III subunit delta [Candidatus Omnitrophota bacterium]